MSRWIPLFLAVLPTWTSAVELSTILTSLKGSGIPDTSEYRVTTTFMVGDQPMKTTVKIVQGGRELQWSESTVGGRTLRIVRNADRQRIIDVVSGESHTMNAPPSQASPATDWAKLSRASWTDPVAHGDGIWRIRQRSNLDSGVSGRILEWSEIERRSHAMFQWNSMGDTIRARVRWIAVEGRTVPEEIEVESGKKPESRVVVLRFTEWRFPRSIPASLFAIP